MIILLCGLLLTPPSATEIEKKLEPKGHITYILPDGYGINNISLTVEEGQDNEGLVEAQILLDMLKTKAVYFFNIGEIEISIKAHSKQEAISEIKRWMKVIGGSL